MFFSAQLCKLPLQCWYFDCFGRGVATCTHGRTCVPEKVLKKGKSGFICSPCAKKKENIQKIISEFTGKNDRTLSLCL